MASKVSWFEIMGTNGTALQEFYADIFGWQLQRAPGEMNYAMLSGEDGGIGGGIGDAQQGNYVTVYIEVEDPQAFLDRIEQKGGQTVVPVTEIPNMVTFAQFRDPEGNVVGLVKSQQQG
jgi:predicted enzyme related to lactoylglutathione lyase